MMVLPLISVPSTCLAQRLVAAPVEDRARAIECLTLAVAYEAGHESLQGKEAVAGVVLNRVRHPAFPKSVCDVVFAGSTRRTGCQFSFTCDGSMRRRLKESTMAAAREVAVRAIDGFTSPLVTDATHYHAAYVSPYWAPGLLRLTQIGLHIFYRLPARGETIGPRVQDKALHTVSEASAQLAPGSVPRFAPWGLALATTAAIAEGR